MLLDLAFRMFHLKVNKLCYLYVTQLFKYGEKAILFKVMCKESCYLTIEFILGGKDMFFLVNILFYQYSCL